MVVEMFGICDPSKSAGEYPHFSWDTKGKPDDSSTVCYTTMSFVGKEACAVDVDKILGPIQKFSSAIEIVIGFALWLFGSRFIIGAFIVIVFLGVSALVFLIFVNLGLVDKILDGHIGVYIGAGIVACLVGGLCGFLVFKTMSKYMVPMLAALVGGLTVAVLLAPIKMIPKLLWAVLIVAGVFLSFKIA